MRSCCSRSWVAHEVSSGRGRARGMPNPVENARVLPVGVANCG